MYGYNCFLESIWVAADIEDIAYPLDRGAIDEAKKEILHYELDRGNLKLLKLALNNLNERFFAESNQEIADTWGHAISSSALIISMLALLLGMRSTGFFTPYQLLFMIFIIAVILLALYLAFREKRKKISMKEKVVEDAKKKLKTYHRCGYAIEELLSELED